MDDETMPPREPMQPVSMHETPHTHHGAWPLIAGMLGVFLVLETIGLGYAAMKYKEFQTAKTNMHENKQELVDKVEDAKAKIPPIVYSPYEAGRFPGGQQLHAIDRQTGQDTILKDVGVGGVVQVVAVPQLGFDGRIFVTVLGEGDSPSLALNTLDINDAKAKLIPVTFLDQLPFVGRQATLVSPDQTKLAAVYYNPDEGETSREVVIWNLLTGEKTVVGTISEGEAFSSSLHGFAGANGYSLSWTSQNCVTTQVYAVNATEDVNAPKDIREFCSE